MKKMNDYNSILTNGIIVPVLVDDASYYFMNAKTKEIVCNEFGRPEMIKSISKILAWNLALSKATELTERMFPGLTVSEYKMLFNEYFNPDDLIA